MKLTIESDSPAYVAMVPLQGRPQIWTLAESLEDVFALAADVHTREDVLRPLQALSRLAPDLEIEPA